MVLPDLSLTTGLLVLFGFLALIILVRGFKMPGNYSENQRKRSSIRKKLILENIEKISVVNDKKADEDQGS